MEELQPKSGQSLEESLTATFLLGPKNNEEDDFENRLRKIKEHMDNKSASNNMKKGKKEIKINRIEKKAIE